MKGSREELRDRVIQGLSSLRLEEIQPLNGRPDVATGFLRSLDLFIALYREKARDLDVPLDDAFIDYMRAFADSETERFLRRAPA